MRGQISDAQAVVYWVHPGGELMLAPDTRMRPFRGWRRVECKTVSEIEQFSRRMAQQEYKKQRSLTVEQHMRSRTHRERIKANCKLRLASGCISPADELMTRRTLQNIEREEESFFKMLVSEPDLSRASLVIERQEDAIGNAQYSRKRRGLADSEVNPVSKLAETTA
jgi:hypothetical protein